MAMAKTLGLAGNGLMDSSQGLVEARTGTQATLLRPSAAICAGFRGVGGGRRGHHPCVVLPSDGRNRQSFADLNVPVSGKEPSANLPKVASRTAAIGQGANSANLPIYVSASAKPPDERTRLTQHRVDLPAPGFVRGGLQAMREMVLRSARRPPAGDRSSHNGEG